jgi:hypothetical protein
MLPLLPTVSRYQRWLYPADCLLNISFYSHCTATNKADLQSLLVDHPNPGRNILSRAIPFTIEPCSVHSMTKQPAREAQRHNCDDRHGPVLVEQQPVGIPFQENTAQDHHEIAHGIDQGEVQFKGSEYLNPAFR